MPWHGKPGWPGKDSAHVDGQPLAPSEYAVNFVQNSVGKITRKIEVQSSRSPRLSIPNGGPRCLSTMGGYVCVVEKTTTHSYA